MHADYLLIWPLKLKFDESKKQERSERKKPRSKQIERGWW